MLSKQHTQKIEERQRLSMAIIIVFLMLASSLLAIVQTVHDGPESSRATQLVDGGSLGMTPVQSTEQGGQGGWDGVHDSRYDMAHEALSNIMWSDPGVSAGIIVDLSVLEAVIPSYSTFLEETRAGDHDNDGIDDLADLDDDNDGIYDLLERFDGCYGTDPYDHDNDGILDVDDWDDDNDGILEGPIDYDALEAQGLDPRNVSTDRYLDPTIDHPHPDIGAIGNFYLADQNPMDHDNDGVTDEDNDGAGPGRYDEDDDNDGRIDQFTWPCDLDSDGISDYFDTDDDNDGVLDVEDAHPYDATITTQMSATASLYDASRIWTFNEYRQYSGGVDYLDWERNRVNAAGASASGFFGGLDQVIGDVQGTPSFTEIIDGDLDGDGAPNFLDPDNDNDGTPDSADTDDDNDGILDMVDPDDDNDGILDACIQIDTNGDQMSDYTGLQNGGVTGLALTDGGSSYADGNNVATSSATSAGTGMTVDITTSAGVVTAVSINKAGSGYSIGDVLTITGGASDAEVSVSAVSSVNFEIPGADGDQNGNVDCEIDYDGDLDDDRLRPFDQNYNCLLYTSDAADD